MSKVVSKTTAICLMMRENVCARRAADVPTLRADLERGGERGRGEGERRGGEERGRGEGERRGRGEGERRGGGRYIMA